jgi:hypothetical protein
MDSVPSVFEPTVLNLNQYPRRESFLSLHKSILCATNRKEITNQQRRLSYSWLSIISVTHLTFVSCILKPTRFLLGPASEERND